jgi:hypothetical protein
MQHKSSFFGAPTAKAHAHRLRCKNLPAMQPGEAERLLAGFLATRSVTTCPTRYAAPIEQQSLLSRSGY